MLYWYIICFYMSSQSWWITLIIHIRKYKQMKQGNVEYTQIRKDIKSIERKMRLTSTLFVFTNYAICIYFAIIQSVYQWKYCDDYEFKTKSSFICIFTDIFQQVYRYFMIALIFVMWCAEYFVYRELTKTMQTALHCIYNMRKKFLKRLLIISMVSLFIFIVPYPLIKYLVVDTDKVAYLESYDKTSISEVYWTMIVVFLINIPLNLYAFMSMMNINFKEYICYIFIGNNMIEELKGASIFLIGKPNIIYEEEVYNESLRTSSEFVSFIVQRHEEFRPDLIVSDLDD